MKTKLENIISTLEAKELPQIVSLITTRLIGGLPKHVQYLEKIWKNRQTPAGNLDLTERMIRSELYKMLEKYIIIRESLGSVEHTNAIILKHFRNYENEKLFNEYYQHAEKQNASGLKNTDYYQHNGELLFEKWQFDQLKNRFSNAKAEEIIHNMEVAMISQKLKLSVSLAPQSALISKQFNTTLLDHLEPYILQNNYLDYSCISLYYFALKMLNNPEDATWFHKFRQTLDTSKSDFNHDELKTLYFQAINYCIRKHNSGEKAFSQLLLDYYKTSLENKFLLTNGYLSKNTYRNINTIAVRMGRFEEAMQISVENISYLRKEEKDSAFRFNMANIHYARREYNKALDALREVHFDDHLSNLFAKTLMLKIYYETKELRLLDSHLDAMQVYLTRKKIIGYHKTNYSNIVKYTRKLMRLNPYDKNARQNLAEKIRNEQLLPDRDWLFSQVQG